MTVGYDCVLSIQHLISTHVRNQEFPRSKLGSKTEANGEFCSVASGKYPSQFFILGQAVFVLHFFSYMIIYQPQHHSTQRGLSYLKFH